MPSPELGLNALVPFQAERSAALLVRGRDRPALAQAAIEADGESDRCWVRNRARHLHDAIDMPHERVGQIVAVAGVEDHQLDRRTDRAKRALECGGRDQFHTTVRALEE